MASEPTTDVAYPTPRALAPMKRAARLAVRVVFGPNPWPRAGPVGHVAMAIVAVQALTYIVGLGLIVSRGDLNYGVFGWDFVAYVGGAAILVDGDSDRLYDASHHREVVRQLLADDRVVQPLLPFVNPPLWAALVAPFYPLGLVAGIWVWRFATLGVALAVLLAVVRQSGVEPGWRRATALLLCFFPLIEAWQHGQMVAAMLVAFGGWLVLVRAGRPSLAGLALSLSLLKPQYAPFMVVFLAWKRQWRQLQGFAIGAAIQAALNGLIFLPVLREGRLPSFQAVTGETAFESGGPSVLEVQLNLRAALWNAAPDVAANLQLPVLVGLTVAAMGAFLWLSGTAWQPYTRGFLWQVLALYAFVLISSFHNHVLTLYLLLLPLAPLLISPAGAERDRTWLPAALAVMLALPGIGFVLSHPLKIYYVAAWVTVVAAIGLGLMAYRDSLAGAQSSARVGWEPPIPAEAT